METHPVVYNQQIKSIRVVNFDLEKTSFNNISISHNEVVNFDKNKRKNCVMCDRLPSETCYIPKQNKQVCKDCDSSIWLYKPTNVYFKFCKGIVL